MTPTRRPRRIISDAERVHDALLADNWQTLVGVARSSRLPLARVGIAIGSLAGLSQRVTRSTAGVESVRFGYETRRAVRASAVRL